jgi:hypothetical protein
MIDPIRVAQAAVIVTLYRAGKLGFAGIALREPDRFEVQGQKVWFHHGPVLLGFDGERHRVVVISAGTWVTVCAVYGLDGAAALWRG